ncbi:MAG TPA: AmmeMemoRadiSam system protein B [Bacteroidales bacterium]|nr:AmmeMemoRadiSam system protein B [Bacteroidales bacterium]
MSIRKAVVAGRFYPAKKDDIIQQIEEIKQKEYPQINLNLKNKKIIGGVVPHAGYMFSAYQAVHFFEILKQSKHKYDTIIIINPNHTGFGHEIAFDDNEAWETPLGKVDVDTDLGKKLGIPVSGVEQQNEHSAEVMVPFLQHFLDYPFKIAPITLSHQTFKNAKHLAGRIKDAADLTKRKILIIASSDFSHFLTPEQGKEKDHYVIENILNLNSVGVEKVIKEKNISVCGYGPIITLMEYAKLVSEKPNVDKLKTGHSGEIIPSNEVVDYVSILFSA